MNTKITGNAGEQKAADFLIENGYSILERNWRTKGGEIDIIALKEGKIVFVEVKSLPNGTPELLQNELNRRKLQRIVKTSKCFLLKHRQYSNSYVRYDVIVIDMPGFPGVYHIENAFTELL
ncbi:MAG: YraN family protein [Treponema sp.]|nr:YraN family protein [Treponema sp.]